MVHGKIMTGGTHSKKKRYRKSHLANVVKEQKKNLPDYLITSESTLLELAELISRLKAAKK